jgi:hypothetical protein
MTWTTITTPAVGDKITAAGFGLQVVTSSLEQQVAWSARPGGDMYGLTGTPVSVSAGPTTIAAGPASGRRLVKQLWLSGPIGATVTLTLASKTLANISLVGGVFTFPTCIPIAAGENLQATVTGGPVVFVAPYGDRADALVDRLGYASGQTSGTLIASSGTAKVITHLWVANTSASVATTAQIDVGATTILSDVAMTAGSFVTFDEPLAVPAGTAVTWSGDNATDVTYMAVGR